MINLSASGGSITFEFSGNSGYLQEGVITCPVNSLSLILESDSATFRKSASNDIFVSARYEDFGMSKAELETWFKNNAVGSTGGGGGDITSGEVQTMIDESISGKADTSAVTEAISAATDDMATKTWVGEQGYLTEHQSLSAYSTTEEVNSAITEAVSGKVDTTDFNTYSAATDERITEDEEVTASALNTLNSALSGKQDTLIAGDNITISGNVISATGGGSGNPTVELTQAQYDALVESGTVEPNTYYIITDAPAVDISNYWTSAQTNSAINAAVSGKQDTLSAGTNITISGNVISATGGGTIDPSLDSGSTNAVANSAVTTAINSKADKSEAFGSYSFGSDSNGDFLRYKNVKNNYIGNSIYYPTINGKGILTSNSIYARNNYNFQLVETSAITSSVTSASTDSQIPSAKAVYDAIQEGGGGVSESAFTAYTASTDSRIAEDEEVTASALNTLNSALGGFKLQQISQADYDALVSGGTVDNSTLYIITNVVS